MTRESAGTRLVREICVACGGALDEATVEQAVRKAMADLWGNVAPEALPEMAARLVVTRLDVVRD